MSGTIEGRFFLPAAARHVPARASAEADRILRIVDEGGAVLAEAPALAVTVTARLAKLTRRFDLPGGARFETDDNDGADALLRALRKWRRGRFTDRLERAWPIAGLSLLVSLLAGTYFISQAVPIAAEWLALRTLPDVAHTMSEQTLLALDRVALRPTALPAADQAKAARLFTRVAAHAKGGTAGYRLVFRGGGVLGPNAFALPDGTIVMTDQLWAFVKADAEIEGVFAHEMSHVDHAHQLQRVYEATLVPAGLAVFTGDMSQVSQIGAILPGIILQSAYSRRFESQADDDGAATLRRMHEKPSHMADLLQRIDRSVCGKEGCPPSWIGNHPDTPLRAARLRAEDKGPIAPAQDCLRPWKTGISLRCLGWD
ncbi:MAG TPA: M48 family metallopeptidase [Rhizomicrobium sp.]